MTSIGPDSRDDSQSNTAVDVGLLVEIVEANGYRQKIPVLQAHYDGYLRRFIVFWHICIRPAFASLSGNSLMAAMALSAYSWANARVFPTPSLWKTSSRA